VRAVAADGPCLLDAIEADLRMSKGQKETLRSVYTRFVPGLDTTRDRSKTEGVSVEEAVDADARLSRGQREAIRTMVSTFLPKNKVTR
jgi:hypothetical protein